VAFPVTTRKKSKCTVWEDEPVKIRVRYFAAFREAAGLGSEDLDALSRSPAELFQECSQRHHGLKKYSSSLVAINDEMASWDTQLNENDEVLFFPPVAGG
jgi:molybdopterin converting factor small subunit